MRKIEAHPDAAIFPMMSAEELADLAADIKENGQRFPIIIGTHEEREVIVDGRNRFEACEIAGVEPKFEKLNGHDPKAFILSANVNRRHMTASQLAMAVAMMYPENTPIKRDARGRVMGKESRSSPGELRPHRSQLSRARVVLRHSRPLAEAVLAGSSLEDAFQAAKLAADAIKSSAAMLARLRAEAPDLADLVTEERLKLSEAITALDSRIAEARRAQETATRVLQSIFNALFPRGATAADWADRLTKDVNADFWSGADALTHTNLEACAHVMEAIAKRVGWPKELP